MKQTLKITLLFLIIFVLAGRVAAQDCKALWQQATEATTSKDSVIFFEKYINKNCKDSLAEAHVYIVMIQINDEEIKKIKLIERLDKAIALKPTLSKAYYLKGLISDNSSFGGGRKYFDKAIELDSNYADAYYERAISKAYSNDDKNVIQDLNMTIKLNPKHIMAYSERASIKFDLKDYSGAIQDYDAVLQIDPKKQYAYQERGEVRAKLKDYKGAIEDYNQAIRLDIGDIEEEDSFRKNKNNFYNRGAAKFHLKDYVGALLDCDTVIQLDSTYYSAYFKRGALKIELKDYLGAIQDYDKVLQLDSTYYSAYFERGALKIELKDYLGAIQDYDKVLQMDSDWGDAYYRRGQAKFGLKDYTGALRDFNKVIDLKQYFDFIFCWRGKAYMELNRYMEALSDFDKAIVLNDQEAVQYNYRGYTHLQLKHYSEAIADWNTMQTKAEKGFNPPYVYLSEAEQGLKLAELNLTKPIVTFTEKLPPSVFKPHLTIKGCVNGREIKEFSVFVNEKSQRVKDFVRKSSSCDRVVLEHIELKEGDNEIYLAATNSAGTVYSDKKIVKYQKPVTPQEVTASVDKRIVLSIGNNAYKNQNPLKNPVNDADSVASVLHELGFDTIVRKDVTRSDFISLFNAFIKRIEDEHYDVAVFFYSGHGIEMNKENYLLPIDYNESKETPIDGINLNHILDSIRASGTRVNLFFLDCCRTIVNTNDLKRNTISKGGFSNFNTTAKGFLISYATGSGETANDNCKECKNNSPYTTSILRHIRTPNMSILDVLSDVHQTLDDITNGGQIPAEYHNLRGRFYFKQ